MADSDSLRVMCLFEAGARLHCNAETICLAAHLYHRFFRINQDLSRYDLYTFGSACLQLAHWFYERKVSTLDLARLMANIVHGSKHLLEGSSEKNLVRSIEMATKVVTMTLNYEIDYKDTKPITPGRLLRKNVQVDLEDDYPILIDSSDEESDEDGEDRLLAKNSKRLISPHRYLAHYLKTIKILVNPADQVHFKSIATVAWIILTDFYWSPCVTQHSANHIACACLTLAVEAFRGKLDKRQTADLWALLSKKLNLIFCDELSNEELQRIMNVIVQQYSEYERVIQHELNTYVIDPKT